MDHSERSNFHLKRRVKSENHYCDNALFLIIGIEKATWVFNLIICVYKCGKLTNVRGVQHI